MSSKKGIKMGVDPVMDKNIYDNPNKRSKEYVSSINPNNNSDSDEDMTQQIQTSRQKYANDNNISFPQSLHSFTTFKSSHHFKNTY